MEKANKKQKKSVLKVLTLLVPFVLISIAIVLTTLWLFNNVIASSSVYRLITNSSGNEDQGEYIVIDDAMKERIKEQNVAENYGTPKDFPIITYGQEWARLTIEGTERVNNVRVNAGDSYTLMLGAVGFNFNTSYPGLGRKTVLSGHVRQEFKELDTVKAGTKVYLNTIYGDYVYEVYDTVIFAETDPSLLEDKGDEEVLVIYTCYPYASTVRRTRRLALLCKRITGKDWTEVTANEGN